MKAGPLPLPLYEQGDDPFDDVTIYRPQQASARRLPWERTAVAENRFLPTPTKTLWSHCLEQERPRSLWVWSYVALPGTSPRALGLHGEGVMSSDEQEAFYKKLIMVACSRSSFEHVFPLYLPCTSSKLHLPHISAYTWRTPLIIGHAMAWSPKVPGYHYASNLWGRGTLWYVRLWVKERPMRYGSVVLDLCTHVYIYIYIYTPDNAFFGSTGLDHVFLSLQLC